MNLSSASLGTVRDCTLNVQFRMFRYIYTLHFLEQHLTNYVAAPSRDSLIDDCNEELQVEISDDDCHQLRTATLSVQEFDAGEWDDELRDKAY